MMDNVFYQGETIPVVISGDEKTDLRMYNFVMLVYLHYDSKDFQLYYKHDFTEEYVDGETKFRCVIPHQTTGEMTQGDYTIEIVIPENDGYRSVYQKTHAFTLKFSNAKNIEL